MTITVYSDVILPESVVAAGVSGKQIRSNARTQNQGGYATINVVWDDTLREFDLGIKPMDVSAWQEIEGLQEITDSGAYGFLMLDPKDQTVTTGQGLLQPYLTENVGTIGFGYGIPTYRLAKQYTTVSGSRTKNRRISRPLTSAVTRAGSPVTVGVAAGNIAIATETGTVTFVADESQAITSITTGATTVLNFANGTGIVAALAPGQRVYITGVTGTGASALNGLSHVIASEGATSLTINTDTTGLTLASGTAAKYPQATEALAWTGTFYVPVHFVSDILDWELLRPGNFDERILAGPSVTVREVRE